MRQMLVTVALLAALALPAHTSRSAAPTTEPAAKGTATGQPKRGGRLIAPLSNDVRWDPHGSIFSRESQAFHLMYSRLFTLHQGPPSCQVWPPDPELAQSWRWINDKTLEIALKEGFRFADNPRVNGRLLTAQDVAASLERAFKLMPAARPSARLTERIEIVNDRTLRFHLTTPFPSYIENVLAQRWAIVMPKEILRPKIGMTWEDHVGMGSGPFLLTSYQAGTAAEFRRNPNYIEKGLPYVESIHMPIMREESSMVAGLKTGQIDVAQLNTSRLIRELKRTAPSLQVQECPYPAAFVVDMRGDKPPLNDVRVRRALSMGIDREALGNIVYAGQYVKKLSPVHSLLGDYALNTEELSPELRSYIEYNPKRARQLLKEAGYASGLNVAIVMSPGYSIAQNAIAELLTSAWAKIGVTVKLKPMEPSAFSRLIFTPKGGDYSDMVIAYASSATVYEAVAHYFECKAPRNLSRVCDPDLEKMINQMILATDDKSRKAVVADIQRHLIDRQYRLELPQDTRAQFFQPWVRNVWFRTDAWPQGDSIKRAWIDK